MKAKASKERILFGPDGEVISRLNGDLKLGALTEAEKADPAYQRKMFGLVQQLNTYLQGLSNVRMPAEQRAMDPFSNHVWVFAAAMTTATVAAQAPFAVMRETPKTTVMRRKAWEDAAAQWKGGSWPGPRAGKGRVAMERYSKKTSTKRLTQRIFKGIEPDYENPLYQLFKNPNPFQDMTQLMQSTIIWLQVRGEVFWVLTDENGEDCAPGEIPARCWPLSPDLFEPCYEYGDHGDLMGWYYTPPCWMPNAGSGGGSKQKVLLPLTSVVQFKYANPNNPVRGMSRITAAAMGVETDLLISSYNRALLRNNGVPRGIVTYPGLMKPKEEEAYLAKWKDNFEGEQNAGKTAILANGFQYQNVGLSHEDMQYIDQLKWDREMVLAVMGMPPSVLGVTEFTNYATQLGQDKNLWDKLILPIFQLMESAIDRSIFFVETDDVFPLFDVSDVEALRAGLREKLDGAKAACGPELHMTPEVAYELYDVEVPQYPGSDVCLVNPMLSPANLVVTQTSLPSLVPGAIPPGGAGPAGAPGNPASVPGPGEPILPPEAHLPVSAPPGSAIGNPKPGAGPIKPPAVNSGGPRRIKTYNWATFNKFVSGLEAPYAKNYREWVRSQREEMLARFDKIAGTSSKIRAFKVDLGAALPDPKQARNALIKAVRPANANAASATYNFTEQEIGPPVFDIDDARIVRFFHAREKFFADEVTATQLSNWRESMMTGVKNGESLQDIRNRIVDAFDLSESSGKAMTIARTESTGFTNGMRDEMFGAQGFKEEEWVTAGDLVVRSPHEEYGAAGSKPRDFNYLEISGKTGGGILAFPQDMRCALGEEVINCRCFKIPTK